MEVARAKWTDDRIDERFKEVDERFKEVLGKIDERFDKLDKRLETMDARFERFDLIQNSLISAMATMFATVLAAVLGKF